MLDCQHNTPCTAYLSAVQVRVDLNLDMAAYLSGDQHAGGQEGPASGAYIFRWAAALLHVMQHW